MRSMESVAKFPPSRLGMVVLLSFVTWASLADAEEREEKTRSEVEIGRDLFLKEWAPNETEDGRGDGLGPMFNARSCVACHNLGGPGGAGNRDKDVEILTATVTRRFASLSSPGLRRVRTH